MTYLANREQYLQISRGKVNGHTEVLKFGRNQDLPSGVREDIWDGSAMYPWPSTADITHIHSTDSLDVGVEIEVQGLDVDYNQITQTKALDGADAQTLVALDTPMIRNFRNKNVSGTDLLGNLHTTNAGDSVTYGQITAPFNQTLMALYTVPAGKTAYLTRYYALINKKPNAAADIELYVRPFGQVFQLKHNTNTIDSGSTVVNMPFFPHSPPLKVEEKSDIKITALASAAGVDISAGFDLILVDN
jgi:hypothetical protein